MASGNATILSKLPKTTTISQPNCRRKPETRSSSPSTLTLRTRSLQTPWLGTNNLSTILRPHHKKVRLVAATVSFSLPTAKPETGSSVEKIPKWSWRAIKSFCMAELEARKLKYPTTGTEALPMGILVEGTSLAAKFLRANGITLLKVREETIKLLGKADMYFFSAEHPPLTEDAQRVLDWAIDKKIKSGDSGEITTSYLLLGIWSEVNSPGHKIMATLGFNDEKAKELESLCSEPGFDDD
ncbi:ATP-dependent Clp protease ATP-binding subunit CLPT2, chloroplastic [Morus notabilis]|uniref:ATP-dependent Clp protease ATP-binding subunit CLPT2, chloroplastic n=1 Tax=Morus notabilis TaxID=981085 RepID=UPI000CED066F|nr:ATP-dependent Clp protease ATP-binding subunit CLPT2, chloroplastic [Morus notabilis]